MCLPRVRMPARTINPHLGRRLPVLAACRVTWRAEQKKGARVTSGSPKPAPQVFLSRPSWPFGFHGAITQSSPEGGLGKRFPEKNLPEVWFLQLNFHGNVTGQDGKHVSNAPASPSLMHVSNHMPLACRESLALGLMLMIQHALPAVCRGSLTPPARGMVISTWTLVHPMSITAVIRGCDLPAGLPGRGWEVGPRGLAAMAGVGGGSRGTGQCAPSNYLAADGGTEPF